MDIFIGLVNSVDNLPDWHVKFLVKFKLQNCNQSCWSIIFGGLVEMTFGLVHASYSSPEWQAEKLTFFAVPKVATLVTLGFSSLLLSLLSEVRSFRVAKTCIVHAGRRKLTADIFQVWSILDGYEE